MHLAPRLAAFAAFFGLVGNTFADGWRVSRRLNISSSIDVRGTPDRNSTATPHGDLRGLCWLGSDGQLLASVVGGGSGRLLLWSLHAGAVAAAVDFPTAIEGSVQGSTAFSKIGGAGCVDADARGNFLAVGGDSGSVGLWDVSQRGTALHRIGSGFVVPGNGGVVGLKCCVDGIVTAATTHGTFASFDSRVGSAAVSTVKARGMQAAACSGGEGKDYLWATSCGRSVCIVDMRGSGVVATLNSHSAPVRGVCFDSSGSMIASGGVDRCVRIWDSNASSGDSELAFFKCNNSATAVAGADFKRCLVVGDECGSLWNLRLLGH